MDPSGAVHLVRAAILSKYTGDCDWVDERTEMRVRHDPANQGLRPNEILHLLKAWVASSNPIFCKREVRDLWKDKRDFVYWVVIDHPEFLNGFFVELELVDPDPSDPRVLILSAHPASF